MSTLYKLSISGVRSFSPKDHETIQFGLPLTLICGQNGCGKTTIIECLKYATTGDLPPNSKGGAFINDPAIADRLTVNAEVKLGFVLVGGKLMTVTRNMQLTRKRAVRGLGLTSNTFKTLEGLLAVISNGQKSAVSSKIAELDTRVPAYLGASKAVLEYVIFCHQDDSLWPLSEPAALKKRFDEIFEALKFTKALENLKSIRKEMATDVKLLEQSVSHYKIDKERAGKIREKVADLLSKVELYTAEIGALTLEIEKYEREAEKLFSSNQSFQKVLSEWERLRLVLESTQRNHDKLQSSIDILTESDEELTKLLNFGEAQRMKQERLDTAEMLRTELESDLQHAQTTLNSLSRKEGELAGKLGQYESNCSALQSLCEEHGSTKERLLSDVERRVADSRKRLESLLTRNEAESSEKQKKFQEAYDDVMLLLQLKRYRLEERSKLATEIEGHRAKLAKISLNAQSLEMDQTQLEALIDKLAKKKAATNFAELGSQLQLTESKISALELELDEVMRKMTSANKQADVNSKIDLLEESIGMKSTTLSKIVASHGTSFEEATNCLFSPSDCSHKLEDVLSNTHSNQKKSQKEVDALQNKLEMMESYVLADESTVEKLSEAKSKALSAFTAVLEEQEIDKYAELVTEAEEEVKAANYNLNTFEVTKTFKIKAAEVAKTTKCCSLCNRGFSNSEMEEFVAGIQANINDAMLEKLKSDVAETNKDLSDLLSVRDAISEYKRSGSEISQVKARLEERQAEIRKSKDELKQSQASLDKVEEKLVKLNELKKPLANIERLQEEITQASAQLVSLKESLTDFGGKGLSMKELQRQHQIKTHELKDLRRQAHDLKEELEMGTKEISRLEGQIKDKQLTISDSKNSVNEAGAIRELLSRAEESMQSLDSSLVSVDTEIQTAAKKRDALERLFQDFTEEGKRLEAEQHNEVTSLEDQLKQIKALCDAVAQYESHDAKEFAKVVDTIKTTKNELSEITQKKEQAEEDVSKLQMELADAAKIERNVQDNLELRHLEQEIVSIKQSIDDLNASRARAEEENYQEKSKSLRDKISELNSEHAGKVGEMKQIKDQVSQLRKELDVEYKDVEEKYHHEWIKLQTKLLVSNDIQTYSKALDSAIMKYHSTKMDEINRTLNELWNQTYRGTDIDRIEIKCDVNTQSKARTYNYRVVMYKKASELDMRGRCSAGQKVLTSILIRLALAECFGTNCGMIALDEPTTNLDEENAESLAHALNNIIDLRKNQKNFQLIIITHDEKFLGHINGNAYTEKFYRVQRDEHQHSVIKSLPIHLMHT